MAIPVFVLADNYGELEKKDGNTHGGGSYNQPAQEALLHIYPSFLRQVAFRFSDSLAPDGGSFRWKTLQGMNYCWLF